MTAGLFSNYFSKFLPDFLFLAHIHCGRYSTEAFLAYYYYRSQEVPSLCINPWGCFIESWFQRTKVDLNNTQCFIESMFHWIKVSESSVSSINVSMNQGVRKINKSHLNCVDSMFSYFSIARHSTPLHLSTVLLYTKRRGPNKKWENL